MMFLINLAANNFTAGGSKAIFRNGADNTSALRPAGLVTAQCVAMSAPWLCARMNVGRPWAALRSFSQNTPRSPR